MEELRKLHNNTKREFIKTIVKEGSTVLDVGSGRGGDLAKWKAVKATLTMIDPDPESIKEAIDRSKNVFPEAKILVGDVTKAPLGPFDYVCFNFSLQYCFKDEAYLRECVRAISMRLAPGGMFFGVVPDAEKILRLPDKWTDPLGNTIERGPSIGKSGQRIGEMILVKLADGPYYASGSVPEPLLYFPKLVEICFEYKLALAEIKSFVKEKKGTVTDIYARFVFRKLR
jgi:SAM-dependent methyltransferase